VVQNVEQFSSKLEFQGLPYREIPMDSEVPLGSAEPAQEISWHVPLPKWIPSIGVDRWIHERGWIKRFAPRVLWPKEIKGLSRNDVRSNIRLAALELDELGIKQVHRWRGTRLNNSLNRPAAQNCIGELIDLRTRNVICDAD